MSIEEVALRKREFLREVYQDEISVEADPDIAFLRLPEQPGWRVGHQPGDLLDSGVIQREGS